jgi:deoxyribonuclease V
MRTVKNHRGNRHIKPEFSVERAHEAQLRLSKQVVFKDRLPKKIRLVAGVDVAYVKDIAVGAVAVLDYDSLTLTESQVAICKACYRYVPTLLSFRETMPAVVCIRKLKTQPNLFLVDAHGFAHPYRCGFASHLGLVIRKPTIGVAKKKLVGEIERIQAEEDTAFINYEGKLVGAAVTTKHGNKPVYVSVGHMISLKTAIKIVKHCTKDNRIPQPILKAHAVAAEEKRKINILQQAKAL